MQPRETLLFTRQDVSSLIAFDEYIDIVEQAFRRHAEGKTWRPQLMHAELNDGAFHLKVGGLRMGKPYFGLKLGGDFPENVKQFSMPRLQGVIVLCDGENGYPLAIMDSIEITIKRTAALTAVAAKYLANPDSRIASICGCGQQGRAQLRALMQVLPLTQVYAFDIIDDTRIRYAREMSEELGIAVEAVDRLESAVKRSHVCVTCTPSKRPYLEKRYVSAGTFISAVGADSPDKQELDAALLRSNKVIVDLLEQCAQVGELHHALERGMSRDEVYAELSEVIAGKKLGRGSKDEIIIFDTTGTALQDVAAAVAVYEKGLQAGRGMRFDFFAAAGNPQA